VSVLTIVLAAIGLFVALSLLRKLLLWMFRA